MGRREVGESDGGWEEGMNTVNGMHVIHNCSYNHIINPMLHLSTCSTSLIPRPGNEANAVPI